MKIIATDSAHACVPYHLLGYFCDKIIKDKSQNSIISKFINKHIIKKFEYLSPRIENDVLEVLDGFECLLPASLIINSKIDKKRAESFRNFIEKIREKKPGFDYLAFHGLYEKHHPFLSDFNLNLADNDSISKASKIEQRLMDQIKVMKMISYSKRPILNLHMGWIPDESHKYNGIKNLERILESVLSKEDNILICFENMPPAKVGYNIGQNPEDLSLLNTNNFKITYDISHLECARYNNLKFLKELPSENNISHFREYHKRFLDFFKEDICYMHWSFNDLSLNDKGNANGYYGQDRHCPPERFIDEELIKKAFGPVSEKAFDIIEDNMGEKACINIEVPRSKILSMTYYILGATTDELKSSYYYARSIKNKTYGTYQ